MTGHLTPGRSPFALPMVPPMHSTMTSSCSSICLIAPSLGANAVIIFPFFLSCTRTHFRMALFGCFASLWVFSSTIPFACEAPPRGSAFSLRLRALLVNHLEFHLKVFLRFFSRLPANNPLDFPLMKLISQNLLYKYCV